MVTHLFYMKYFLKMREWLATFSGLVEYTLVSFAFPQVHILLVVRKLILCSDY